MITTLTILVIQLLYVSHSQNPFVQSDPASPEDETKAAFTKLQSLDQNLKELILEALKPTSDGHRPQFFTVFGGFDVNKIVTRLSLNSDINFMLNEANQLDPHQTFMKGTRSQNSQYLLTLHQLDQWPEGQIQHFNKSDFEMPQLSRKRIDILKNRDSCDLQSCFNSGSIYAILKDFVVSLDIYPGGYLGKTASDDFFWNEQFFKVMFEKYKHDDNKIVGHEDVHYLILLAQFQTLKELRINKLQTHKLKEEFKDQITIHRRDLENKLEVYKNILTDLKNEIDDLREVPSPSVEVERPLVHIPDSISHDITSLTNILEMFKTDDLIDFKIDIQSKLLATQQRATEVARDLADLRTLLTRISATVTSFDSQEIGKEIDQLKEEIDPDLESIHTFTEKLNSEFSTTLEFIQEVHGKTRRFSAYLQKTYVKYGILSMLMILSSLISFKIIQILWKSCICCIREINIFYKYHNMVLQNQPPIEDEGVEQVPPEIQLPLINARFRGLQ